MLLHQHKKEKKLCCGLRSTQITGNNNAVPMQVNYGSETRPSTAHVRLKQNLAIWKVGRPEKKEKTPGFLFLFLELLADEWTNTLRSL